MATDGPREETLPGLGPGDPPCVVQHRYAVVDGLRFHYVEAQPTAATAQVALLLHGFPEFWYSWRHQIPALAAAGFRVLAPDLRGYNETDKPAGVENYRLGLLAADVAGLIRLAGAGRAIVVGHDWGGGVAWAAAQRYPGLIERLVILNAPHPAAFRRELGNPAQWLRSSYMLFFQLPALPEWLLRAGDYALLERTLGRRPARRDAFTPEDIRRYKQALDRPGARTATLNCYRALFRYPREAAGARPVRVPTLLIWGERDPYLGVRLTEGLERWVPNLQVARIADAGHWVQNEAPGRVNELMRTFLRDAEAGPADLRHE